MMKLCKGDGEFNLKIVPMQTGPTWETKSFGVDC